MWLTWESWRTVINDQWKEGGQDKCYQGNQVLELNMPVTVTEECLCRNELRQCASLHTAVGLRRTQRVCDTLGTYTQHCCFMYWIASVRTLGENRILVRQTRSICYTVLCDHTCFLCVWVCIYRSMSILCLLLQLCEPQTNIARKISTLITRPAEFPDLFFLFLKALPHIAAS